MRRREFITGLGGAAATWPLAARAQQPAMPVVGFLRIASASGSAHFISAFRQGLNEAGFVEGRNVAIEYRWADDQPDRVPEMAADLVRHPVAVIVTTGNAVPAVRAATASIPIIFLTGYDPVRTGFVTSLSRPGGNLTGVVFTSTDLVAKQLELLHELVPKAAVIAVLLDPNQLESDIELREAETAGRAIGQQILIVKVASEREFDAAFAMIVQAGAGALLIGGSPIFINQRRRQLVTLSVRHALPAIHTLREFPEAGGLMSYGPSLTNAYRRAGNYAGRILRGEKPADLPVELAAKFDLVINLATAKGMGVDVPPTLLARADEVIE
jgi:putative tryptophan/tyrosine transport system substrate-binding protein